MFGMQMGRMGQTGQVGGFSWTRLIASMYQNGEQGAWYDPSDMSTLFQDSAGTVPVTAVEQPVGRILDKSGRGNHATQATTTKRPVLKIDAGGCYYLSFDGVDDALQTSNIDFTGTDKMTVWAGVTYTNTSVYIITELSNSPSTNPGSFYLAANDGPNLVGAATYGTGPASLKRVTLVPGTPAFISATYDLATPGTGLRVNTSSIGPTPIVGTTRASFHSGPLFIGARGGANYFFNGRLYSLIVRGAQSSLSQIEATEAYIKQKMRLP